MIQIKDIKPIPKYILKKIKSIDDKCIYANKGYTRFYNYYTKIKKDLAQITVAVRCYHNKWYNKQVVVKTLNSEQCFIKDIIYYHIAGYKVGWYNQGISKESKWFEDDCWDYGNNKYFDLDATCINKDFILKIPEFKYSAIKNYHSKELFKYLRLYLQYPIAEMLVKLDLHNLATSKMILKEASTNKSFRKWLYLNRSELMRNWYEIPVILKAFKKKANLRKIQQITNNNRELSNSGFKNRNKDFLSAGEENKFINYLNKQDTNIHTYEDYLNACKYLNIDLNEDKNKYPKDFKRWHDIRIDEYRTAKLEADKKEKERFNKKFKDVADKYKSLQRTLVKDNYYCLIALNPNQLVYEGKELHHCVGSFNYHQKFAREESLIFFIRNKIAPNKPYVTLEYSIEKKKVLQCYGDNDSTPTDEVLSFVNNVWLPYANRKLRAIAQ